MGKDGAPSALVCKREGWAIVDGVALGRMAGEEGPEEGVNEADMCRSAESARPLGLRLVCGVSGGLHRPGRQSLCTNRHPRSRYFGNRRAFSYVARHVCNVRRHDRHPQRPSTTLQYWERFPRVHSAATKLSSVLLYIASTVLICSACTIRSRVPHPTPHDGAIQPVCSSHFSSAVPFRNMPCRSPSCQRYKRTCFFSALSAL